MVDQGPQTPVDQREQAVVSSALWAAAGDALGWMTELGDKGTLIARTGVSSVAEPIAWKRLIGGRAGVKIPLPAGTYSDDTQLRLSVCRAIRGNGTFDAEAFGRIELTAWQGYALGAGRATKAAAANLSRRGVNWFSNFFDGSGQRYIAAGGNGAAMRIQPHVWGARGGAAELLLPVMRNALTTHGHPHGFCGAVFHALALLDSLENRRVSAPSMWHEYVSRFQNVPTIIQHDRQLAEFWRPAWEQVSESLLTDAVARVTAEADQDIDDIREILAVEDDGTYGRVLERLGCLNDRYRGSGLKTALASSALAWLYRDRSIKEALVVAANMLGSDTDTIGTMVGALLGPAAELPDWPIQDRIYISTEASRLAAIARGVSQDSFAYPDLLHWHPPSTQSDAVGRYETGLAVVGLGAVEPLGAKYETGDAVWQWLKLPFGQTILGKRRKTLRAEIELSLLPGQRRSPAPKKVGPSSQNAGQSSFPDLVRNVDPPGEKARDRPKEGPEGSPCNEPRLGDAPRVSAGVKLDGATDAAIKSDFDDHVLGSLLNQIIDASEEIETAVAFAAVVAKAKIARRKRRAERG